MGISNEALANLSLEIKDQSPQENLKSTAIEIFRRAVLLDDAARVLKLDYTYDVIRVDKQKREARKQLGGMSAEVVELMRDELLIAGVRAYLQSGFSQLTKEDFDSILGGGHAR